MQRFLEHVTDLRLLLLVQGDKPRYRLVELHRKRVEGGERSVLVGLQSFAEGLDLKGELLSQVHIHKIAFPPKVNGSKASTAIRSKSRACPARHST